jgi:putative glutathione S-transferase
MAAKPQFAAEEKDGAFQRQQDAFRHWIVADPTARFSAEPGRYHLYVSLACPWAHRTVIVRHVKCLEAVIGLTVVDPERDERGWRFRDGPGHSTDPVNGFAYLSEAYRATDPSFSGRFTVPVLWDKKTTQIVNNSEDDICRMFNDVFAAFSRGDVNLFPIAIETEHAKLSAWIYERINNGVYEAGFATSQTEYERACRTLFTALDELEIRLATQRYLFGPRIVEADWRLFCTLVRFDAVYHGHFKCNLRRIVDYPNLSGYLRDLYQQPGIADTVNLDHIKRHYYVTHTEINPTGIVPLGPLLDLNAVHGREKLA